MQTRMSEQSELRRRSGASAATEADQDHLLPGTSGLTANSMLASSPTQHGPVYKLHIPLLFTLLPTFLQNFVCAYGSWWLFSWVAPRWTERYLVQIGNYLYKFQHASSNSPKGTPLPMEAIDAQIVAADAELGGVEFALHQPPTNCRAVFRVSTLRKQHYYSVYTRQDAQAWIISLQEGRRESVTRSMGHARNVPYPKAWEYFDTLAKSYLQSKDRIRQRLEDSETRNMDISKLGDGGPGPRGYFG